MLAILQILISSYVMGPFQGPIEFRSPSQVSSYVMGPFQGPIE